MVDTDDIFDAETNASLLLHDVARCLALVNQGSIRVDRRQRLSRSSRRRLSSFVCGRLGNDTANDGTMDGIQFLLSLAKTASLVVAVDEDRVQSATNRLAAVALMPPAASWLQCPHALQLQTLRAAWASAPEINWCQPARANPRPVLAAAMSRTVRRTVEEVSRMPVSSWTELGCCVDRLTGQMECQPRGVARNIPAVRKLFSSQARNVIVFLLWFVLPSLGAVDILERGTEEYVRPSQEGKDWLTDVARHVQRLEQPPSTAAIELQLPAGDGALWGRPEASASLRGDLMLEIPTTAPAWVRRLRLKGVRVEVEKVPFR